MQISRLTKFLTNMSSQAKISLFFSPRARPLTDKCQTKDESCTPPNEKKVKLADNDVLGSKENRISPEQRQRMDENRKKALAKLQAKPLTSLLVNVGESWDQALQAEFSKTYFVQLSTFVKSERQKGTVYPTQENVFSWTRACPLDQVKVVILGQDPYHGPNQAHGLCFSVLPGVPPPPSLLNMYKELESDIEGFKRPNHGYLQGWAQQGVLLLNAVMTVKASKANSHKDKGWEKFTDATISYLDQHTTGLVFILWGAYAQKKGARINKNKHQILKGVHPSPLSAHRGFVGCKHFSKCNQLLEDAGKTPINWSHLPDS